MSDEALWPHSPHGVETPRGIACLHVCNQETFFLQNIIAGGIPGLTGLYRCVLSIPLPEVAFPQHT